VGEGTLRARDRWVRLGPALLLGVALCAPVALAQVAWSTAPDNLVGIKGAHELAILRRTTGAVDPLAYLLPWDFRSPDFRLLSRYGEDFVHCTYLGWVLLIAATVGWIRVPGRRSVAWLALASGVAAVLSLGPVLVHDGGAVLLPGDRAIPLPYLLVERLPGFDRLSILFRLALLPALGVAVLAARAVAGLQRRRGLATVVVTLLAVGEVRLLSPVHGLPAWSDTTASAPIGALAGAPPGAVMNSPAVGGRRYLFEQTLHRKPLTCGLNFPESDATRAVWRVVLEETERADVAPNEFAARVETAACARGVGYLVVHDDPIAQPDRHQRGVRAIEATVAPMIEAPGLRAYRLCPPTLRAGRGG
jgi:hypothetical protein